MPEPTPGAIAYAAFWASDLLDFRGPAWATLPPGTQTRWEAAAQAVRPPFRFALGQRVRWAESVQIFHVEGRSYEERLYATPVILYRLLLEHSEDYLTEDALEADLSPVEDTP